MSNENLPKKILIIDDDPSIAEGLEPQMKRHGIQLLKASNMETGLYLFNQNKLEIAIIELEFEPVSGLVLAQKFRQSDNVERRSIGMIISHGRQRSAEDEVLLAELGDLEFVEKPLTDIKLLPIIIRVFMNKIFADRTTEARGLADDVYKATQDIKKAVNVIENKLKDIEPQKIHATCDLLEDVGKLEDALQIHEVMVKKDHHDLKHQNAVGRLYLKLGKLEEAQIHLKKLDELAPNNIERLEAMAQMYIDLKNPDAAVEKMKGLISLSPEKPDLSFEMFDKLDGAGFHDQAQNLVKETTKPMEVVRHYNNKGVILSKEGKGAQALKDYYTALMFFPKFKENYRILFNISIAEANKKTPESLKAAKAALDKCLQLEPTFQKAIDLRAKLFGAAPAAEAPATTPPPKAS